MEPNRSRFAGASLIEALWCAMMRLSLGASLIMILSAVAAQAKDPLRLGREVTPIFQSIQWNVDPRQKEFSGRTTIDITAHQSLSEFRLHARDMKLDRVILRRAGNDDSTVDVSHTSGGEKGLVIIKAAKPMAAGSYRVEIEFTANFNTQAVSLYRME